MESADTANPRPSSGAPPEGGSARRRRVRPPSPLKNALLILAIVAVFAFGVVLPGRAPGLVRFLYSPVPLVIAVLLIAQYILLKGRDRSRLYKLELDQAREKRREETEFLRRLEAAIGEIEAALDNGARPRGEEPAEAPPSSSRADGAGGPDPVHDRDPVRDRLAALREEVEERI